MKDKLFLMTDNSFHNTIMYFINKEEIDNINKKELFDYLIKSV